MWRLQHSINRVEKLENLELSANTEALISSRLELSVVLIGAATGECTSIPSDTCQHNSQF